jgi:ectoine hydroxylase-related dioxygenase (phytanoyl-CoA dioxygenase family)
MTPSSDLIDKLDRDGFAIVRNVLSDDLRLEILRVLEESISPSLAGVRDLVKKIPVAGRLAESPVIRALVEPVLGTNAQLVRSILFNKSEAANWQVAWHQDLAIAVRQKVRLEGFVSWSNKEGVPHVQPPVEVLERMLNVRVHLDVADELNGALLVSPGSHCLGRIPADEAAAAAKRLGSELCVVNAGDVLLFRPLTLHASRKVTSNRPRRVIHLEFAGISLPAPLAWAEAAVR